MLRLLSKTLLPAAAAITVAFSFILITLAAATVTPATGGSAISADTTGGTFTSLTGPILTEGATGDIGTGTIILNVPSGFVFSTTTNSVTATRSNVSGNCGGSRPLQINGATSQTVTPTQTTITISITRSSSNTCVNAITWSGIQVRPSAGTPLATGDITESGTSVINNVTGSTNFGTLTEVPGIKNKAVFTVQPSSSAAVNTDFSIKPTVAIEDQFGNIETADNVSTVTLVPKLSTETCSGANGTGTLTSTPSASTSTVSSGIIAYTAMSYSYGESIKICAVSPGITSALSNAITVSNPVPTISAISPTSTTAGGSNFTLTVTGTNFVTNSVVNINGSPRSTTFASSTQISATILASDISSAGTSSITVTNPSPGGGTSNSLTLTVTTPAPSATQFVIIPPADGTVDAPITVTIEARLASGTVDTSYNGGVTLNVSGSATGGGLVNIINGTGTKNIADTVAETVGLSLTDTEGTGLSVTSTAQAVFAPGAVKQFILNHPGSVNAGDRAAYSVSRADQYGNPVTAATSTVYLYSNSTSTSKKFYDSATGSGIITSISISSGTSSAAFWYYDTLAGTPTITASDNSSAPDGAVGIADATDALQINPGPAAAFFLNHPGMITAGTRAGYAVNRRDLFGNAVTLSDQTVYLYASPVSGTGSFFSTATDTAPITFVTIPTGSASINFWYEEATSGTYAITASDNSSAPDGATGIADATDSLIVSPAPIVATRLVILPPGPATVDAPASVTIRAEDNSGNLDTTFNGSVTLNVSGSATGGGVVTITGGVGTASVSDIKAEDVNLTLTDSGGTGLNVSSSQILTFAPGAVRQFILVDAGEMAAGTRLAFSVVRKDQYGNLVTSGLTPVYLYSSSAGANKRFYDSASGGSAITEIDILDGTSSANFWYYDELAGPVTVTASDNSSAPDGATGIADALASIQVVPGPIANFVLNNPGDMSAGTRLGYTVSREDSFGNEVTSGINLVYLYSSSPSSGHKFYDSVSGGSVITFAVINNGASSANFWYYDETPGSWTVTASDNSSAPDGVLGIGDATRNLTVSSAPIVATKLVILPVVSRQINTPASVTIRAEDNSGNLDTTFNGSVTLNVSGSATGGGVVTITGGVGAATVNDAVPETVILSLTDTGGTGLDASSEQYLSFTSAPAAVPNYFVGALPLISGVRFSGRAYPGAKINILAFGTSTVILSKSSVGSPSGSFSIEFQNAVPAGDRSFGILMQDPDGRTTQALVYGVNLRNQNNLLQIANIAFPPTVGFSQAAVTKGGQLTVVGYASPAATVSFEVDNKQIALTATAASNGFYRLLYPTGSLALGSHTLRAKETEPSGETSSYSVQKIFTVSPLLTPQVDFNHDGKVNVLDWSIFLSRWLSTNPQVRALDDLNGDGKVDIQDFSIFVRTMRPAQ
ncbi:MAG: hypothetical protein KGL39_01985 [Patescibacteria group bacterium]|nr:hypothetical protein [Patescibacteria group bacterium]